MGEPAPVSLATEIRLELESGDLKLPLLPSVVGEVLSGTMGEDYNASGLAELIQKDQALAAHILRIVNSPSFRGASEIVALQQAITRLGMERIREIALSVSLKGSLFKEGAFDAYLRTAWRASLGTGLWAKEIARLRRKNVETAYLCGLLNAVGTPVLVNRASLFPQLPSEQELDLLVQQLGAAAGVALARSWKLPEPVATSIEYTDDFVGAGETGDIVAMVVAAKTFYWAQPDAGGTLDVATLVQQSALQFLNLYPEDVERLLSLRDQVEAEMDAMSI